MVVETVGRRNTEAVCSSVFRLVVPVKCVAVGIYMNK